MSTIRRIGGAVMVAVVAVSVLGSGPAAHAKDTSWSVARSSPTVVAPVDAEPEPVFLTARKDTSWG